VAMVTIRKERTFDAPPDEVWDAVRAFDQLHERLARGFVVSCDGNGSERDIVFFNGAKARERLVSIDDDRRRLVYSVTESQLALEHHQSSVELAPAGDARTMFVWTTDALPDELSAVVDGLMEEGMNAMQRTFANS
jgi:uncharacterized protein YndB with AHSA1/START domain